MHPCVLQGPRRRSIWRPCPRSRAAANLPKRAYGRLPRAQRPVGVPERQVCERLVRSERHRPPEQRLALVEGVEAARPAQLHRPVVHVRGAVLRICALRPRRGCPRGRARRAHEQDRDGR